MAKFLTSLKVNADEFPFVLLENLVYESDVLKHRIVVDAGFQTDLFSIPIPFRNLVARENKFNRAAVVHDWLYVKNGWSRGEADLVLREAMELLGAGKFKRNMIYWAVRSGGWIPWKRYREAEKKNADQT